MNLLRASAIAGIVLALVATACTDTVDSDGAARPTAAEAPPTPTRDPVEDFDARAAAPSDVPDGDAEKDSSERDLLAGVNIAIHDVPLDAVVFDTFDGGSVALSDATEAQVMGLLNAIPPLDSPSYIAGSEARWLDSSDLVLGFVAADGSAWAHPHRVLNFHEIVNTTLGDQPVAVTYCPLCGSGLVFDRRPQDLRHDGSLTFDNSSALYQNDMVMVDEETHTYWWQVSGTGIVGNLTGASLTLLPSMTTSWASWLELHPSTQVLSNDQGNGPSYAFDPFGGYATRLDAGRTAFPTSPEAFADERLRPSTRIIGFDVDGVPAAVAVLTNEPRVVPIAADSRQVVFLDGRGGGALFSATLNGDVLQFSVTEEGFVDDATQSVWNAAGLAIDGPAGGQSLEALPSRSAYWFAWVSTLDGERSLLFSPDGDG